MGEALGHELLDLEERRASARGKRGVGFYLDRARERHSVKEVGSPPVPISMATNDINSPLYGMTAGEKIGFLNWMKGTTIFSFPRPYFSKWRNLHIDGFEGWRGIHFPRSTGLSIKFFQYEVAK